MNKKVKVIQWLILMGSIVTFANLYCYQAVLPLLTEEFFITPAKASLIVSIPTLVLAFGLLIMATISDSFGRKKIMSISLVGSVVVTFFVVLSEQYEWIIFWRAVQGILLAGYPAIAMTYINEEVSLKDVGKVMALYICGSGIGGFLGRFILGFFTDLFHWRIAIACIGIISGICVLLFLYYLPPSKNFLKKQFSLQAMISGMKRALLDKQLICFYLVAFLLLGTFATTFNYLGFPLSNPPFNLTITIIGALFIFQLIGTSGSFIGSRLVQTYNRAYIIIVGLILQIIGAYLTSLENLILFMTGLLFICIGFFISHGLTSSWVGLRAETDIRSYASSYYLLFYYLGSSVMGTFGGDILVFYEWNGVVGYTIIGLVLAALIIELSRRIEKKRLGQNSSLN